ncbi:MAG: tetratricopeptide repeat protein [Pseudomonadota bacterium]|nr:tetratricopeptide repeat protein [Pseudomonadota bacterium]
MGRLHCTELILICAAGMLFATGSYAASNPWADSYYLESQGKYDAAAKVLQSELAKRPADEFVVLRVAWLKYLAGNYNQAASDYQHALNLNPSSLDARLGLILPMLVQKRWREAAQIARQVLETAPWNYYAHVRLMSAEEGQEKWGVLAQHAKEVSIRYPSDATVLVYLARAEAKQGNKAEARAAYRKVLQRIPGHYEASGCLQE